MFFLGVLAESFLSGVAVGAVVCDCDSDGFFGGPLADFGAFCSSAEAVAGFLVVIEGIAGIFYLAVLRNWMS